MKWSAQHRYPLVLLATKLEPTKGAFQLYHDTAAESGYESGTQKLAYLWKVHVDETEEKADEVGRKYVSGVSNPFLSGNEGNVNPAIMNLPGHTSRTFRRLEASAFGPAGRFGAGRRGYDEQAQDYTIISGTPKTVLPKIRHVLEYLRPGSVFFWDGDGAHEPRRPDAELEAHGRRGHTRRKGDGQGAGALQPLRGGPGHQHTRGVPAPVKQPA